MGRDEKPDKRNMRSGLIIMVCAYIVYLGVNILRGYVQGEAGNMPGIVAVLFGIFFIVFGAGYGIYLALPMLKARNSNQAETSGEDRAEEAPIEDKKEL